MVAAEAALAMGDPAAAMQAVRYACARCGLSWLTSLPRHYAYWHSFYLFQRVPGGHTAQPLGTPIAGRLRSWEVCGRASSL